MVQRSANQALMHEIDVGRSVAEPFIRKSINTLLRPRLVLELFSNNANIQTSSFSYFFYIEQITNCHSNANVVVPTIITLLLRW